MTPRTSRAAITMMAKTQAGKGRTIPLALTQSARRRRTVGGKGREREGRRAGGEGGKGRERERGKESGRRGREGGGERGGWRGRKTRRKGNRRDGEEEE